MKAFSFIALVTSILTVSCTASPGPSEITPGIPPHPGTPIRSAETLSTLAPTSTPNTLSDVRWNIYDPNPQHLWNRLFRQFYRRITNDGREYGWDSLDPLLWYDTTYLLEGSSYRQAVSLLDEFLSTNGENLITDPTKRAIFQRDMWEIFDWLTLHSGSYPRELQWRVAQVIRKVALTESEIESLPNNYEAAVKSDAFPTNYQSETPNTGFLPTDLLHPDNDWVCLGREGGPIAMTHTEEFPFFGRSAFLMFIRVPGGREAALRFLQELNSETPPAWVPDGTEIALVRQALLIDAQGNIVFSPIVESLQVRHFINTRGDFAAQYFYEFQLNRMLMFTGIQGGLQPITKEIMLFRSHGDEFQIFDRPGEAMIPSICTTCHGVEGSRQSILSYSRSRFPLPGSSEFLSEQKPPVLIETTSELEANTVITWKQQHPTWQGLQTFINGLH